MVYDGDEECIALEPMTDEDDGVGFPFMGLGLAVLAVLGITYAASRFLASHNHQGSSEEASWTVR